MLRNRPQPRRRAFSVPASVRVGTDVQAVDDVRVALERFGAAYTGRVFSQHEIAMCRGSGSVAAARFAARFAAKEAVLKVLRVDDVTPDLRTIEVLRSHSGACSLRLSGDVARLAQTAGLADWDVSLSHSGPVATATVVAVQRQQRQQRQRQLRRLRRRPSWTFRTSHGEERN